MIGDIYVTTVKSINKWVQASIRTSRKAWEKMTSLSIMRAICPGTG